MRAIRQERRLFYRSFVIVMSLAILALSTLPAIREDNQFWPAIAAVGFVAFLANFPLSIFLSEITVISVVTLGSGLIFGIQKTIWIVALGALIGYIIRRIFRPIPFESRSRARDWWFDLGFEIGINIVPLTLAFTIVGDPGMTVFNAPAGKMWGMAILPAIAFVFLHGLLIWVDGFIHWGYSVMSSRGDVLFLAVIELLPVPLMLVGVEAYPYVGNKFIVLLGGIPAVIAVLLYGVSAARSDLQKRVRELSTLSHVGQALRSSLDLDDLLPAIQEQVMQVLGVRNFYVALVDSKSNELWYPLAVKFGEMTPWPRRPMADRLTDRVIREGEAIILTPQIQSGPDPVGLPPSEEMPQSWLGVPLVTPERVIGCLAVFDLHSGVEFTQSDLELLTTLSAQVSIAIDNALLYDQVQVRAAQLETLNQLTGQITASLKLEEVMSQVCQAVAQVGGSQRSAIYLYAPGEDMVHLASQHGLSDEFTKRNQEFSIASGLRTRCLRTGKAELTPDVPNTSLPVDLVLALQSDNIQALADFPLVTPDGQIGFLSVFHDAPHDFPPDELELLQTFAAQAALAVANAQMHSTTDEILARRVHQLAILEAVGRELSAASHSEQLFSLILDYAIDFTQAPKGGIISYDFETGLAQFKAKHGYEVSNMLPMDKGITLRVLKTGQVENVGDVRLDPDFFDVVDEKTLSQLSVPITHEGKVLGVITLESGKLNAFSLNEQSLVEQLANQAAVALINANLYHETQRHLSEQSTLYQVTARLVGALDAKAAVDILCQALSAVSAPRGLGIYLWDEDTATYRLHSSDKCNDDSRLPPELDEHSLANSALSETKMYRISEGVGELGIFSVDDIEGQVVFFPMRTAHRLLGIAVLNFSGEYEISENLSRLMAAMVTQGAIAIQNARFFSETTQRREQLAAVINSVAESIVMVNTKGFVTLSNHPVLALTGLSSEQLAQAHLQDLSDGVLAKLGYQRTELLSLLEELADGKIPTSPRKVYQIPGVVPVSVLERDTHPVMGTGNQALGWMIVWRDVTEEHQINQEREAIADALIHDLRSPVSAVLGSIDLLDDAIPTEIHNDTIDRSLQVARRGAKRVLRLIMSLLDVARMQSGRIELDRAPVDLFALVPELLMDIEMVAEEYGITMNNEIAEDLPVIFVDEDKISRVITNLLDNAVKFSPEGGEIRFVANATDEGVVIQVCDQGPGISEEYRAIIFERFAQISGQFGRWRGAGLGLAFSRLAVEAHGGKIWVEAPPDGQGSVFTLTLPFR